MPDPEFDRQAEAADEIEHALEGLETEVAAAERLAVHAAKFHLRDTAPGEPMATVADMVAIVQDLIRRLRGVELDLTAELGRHVREAKAERLGNLSDGRQWRLHRTADRKAWDHDEWKRDARKVVTADVVARYDLTTDLVPGNADLVNVETGEAVNLGTIVQEAMTAVQDFHGAGAPKVGTLKRHDLDPGDYCEPVRGNWKLDTIAPSQNHDQQED